MKRIVVYLLALFMLFGCQPTPQEEYVSHKDTETMLESATSGDAAPLEEMANLPETRHIARTVDAPNTRFRITIDADVVLPDTDEIPIVHIGHGALDDETVARIIQYVGNGSKAIEVFPKSFYQHSIDFWMDKRERGDLDKYDTLEQLDAAIQHIVQERNAAPDEPVFSEKSPMETLREQNYVIYQGMSDRGTIFMLRIQNEDAYDREVEYRHDITHADELQAYTNNGNLLDIMLPDVERGAIRLKAPARSQEDAQMFAERLLENLAVSDVYSCVGVRLAPLIPNGVWRTDAPKEGWLCCWEVLFTRRINGVNVTYTDAEHSSDFTEGDMDSAAAYRKPWRYEKLRVYVDDDGLNGLIWSAPYEQLAIVTPAAKILSLDEVLPIFDRMMTYKCTEFENGNSWLKADPSIKITEIRLGLTRVLEKNNLGTAYLVPTYTFFGITDDNPDYPPHGTAGTEEVLVINAVDGSVIDPKVGY
ncbi:MAG: hypothetical protein IKZ44_07525 [Clostridia bacterium]|nr:hypothetical protein [Clostridia bacterium]